MRRYIITIEGWGSAEYEAATASKARYRAFRDLREAGPRWSFRDFLTRITTLHLGKAPR